MCYPLAMCLLRLQRFAEAHQAIKEALAGDSPIEIAHSQDLLFWKGVCEMLVERADQMRNKNEETVGIHAET
jgi:hypothetical protein